MPYLMYLTQLVAVKAVTTCCSVVLLFFGVLGKIFEEDGRVSQTLLYNMSRTSCISIRKCSKSYSKLFRRRTVS